MNEVLETRAGVDRAARRNYLILFSTATLILVALVVLAILVL